MSTPTASNQTPQQPGSASKKATGHVTTPSHLGLASPAPRSVPSPAATRKDHAGKTPVNHPTASSTGSKTLGSTPMVPNLSQTGMSSSPGAHNASFGTPSALAGLGVDLGSTTPGQLSNLLAGGAAMMPTMSDLGLSSRSGKKNEDEERRDKMRRVLKNIGKRKGRVSEQGIRRIGRRLGLDIDLDGESEERPHKVGNRPIGLAGTQFMIDLSLKQQVAQKVDVIISSEGADLGEFATPASEVLLNDLKVSDGIQLHSNLDRFARNLNRLSRLDILCKTGKVNCFNAIYGLYKNLKKLNELEIEAVKARLGSDVDNVDGKAHDEVLRKRSGKPTIHARDRVGLALEYWAAANSSSSGHHESKMEVDGVENSQLTADTQSDVHSLQIEVESWPAPMHTALRISEAWLPETFDIPDPESGESLPWQDPPPTYVTESDGRGNVMAVDGTQQVPDLRFVANLDPPVVLPWNMVNVLSEAGIDLPPIGQIPDFYDASLNVETGSVTVPSEPIEAEQSVLALQDGQEKDVLHHYILDVSKPDHGYKLEKLYFSHPRQLISLLPVLRQWAQGGSLIHSCFGDKQDNTPKPQVATNGVNGKLTNGHANDLQSDSMDLDDTNDPTHDKLTVNIGLSVLPQPTLSVTFPESTSPKIGNTIFQIMPNASLAVTSFEGMDEINEAHNPDGSPSEKAKKIARALESCGDLGVWIEWMRLRR
ncbi:hypothetical protein M409DRAFT_68319 [Zasmidium cellare ATCC 36951]|uniref:Mediator of RNA polymerase II transcription subunit 1 n=1 Tax=Zasmidium cellare ATCC 36951 TaxID=1080233 RepID=A0A6A6CBY7_ZASCE|nr:uncharacterized protein M409DRAFT_68319 [Zasmidium cellare ATCC 36951]KAF2163730.1 hypothetical protein M409DRAFT_68319 [Zasmidium cellare ATCC 36951]